MRLTVVVQIPNVKKEKCLTSAARETRHAFVAARTSSACVFAELAKQLNVCWRIDY